ncbi:MAG: hypothetical protein HYV42_00255 [Candidatus Magasanikbacteria bacterium]|nr:hypothetical protein [Candidatus Magasanikbacteria bacterium]
MSAKSLPKETIVGTGPERPGTATPGAKLKERPQEPTAPSTDPKEMRRQWLYQDIIKGLGEFKNKTCTLKEIAAQISFLKASLLNQYNAQFAEAAERGDSVMEVQGQNIPCQIKIGDRVEAGEIVLLKSARTKRLDLMVYPVEIWQKILEAKTLKVEME